MRWVKELWNLGRWYVSRYISMIFRFQVQAEQWIGIADNPPEGTDSVPESPTPLRDALMELVTTKFNSLRRVGNTVGFPFSCLNPKREFWIEYIEITKKKTTEYRVEIFYVLPKACRGLDGVDLNHVLYVESASLLVDQLLSIASSHDVCPECYSLFLPEEGCKVCLPNRLLVEYQPSNPPPPTCSICLDPVYTNQLSCGHAVHRGCILRMNPYDYYDETIDRILFLRCPLCRKSLHLADKIGVYNMSSRTIHRFHHSRTIFDTE